VGSAFTTEKLSETEIENLKNRSELDGMMAELADYLPSVKETLIDERDRYLAARIWAGGASKQVAVVGAGHLMGIKGHLERIAAAEESADVSELDQIPPASVLAKAAGWIIPL
jgi:pheromone shutdown protein TraB